MGGIHLLNADCQGISCQCRKCKRSGFDPWVRKIPWKWQATPVVLPGKFHGQRSLAGCSPRGCKESDMTERTCRPWGDSELVSLQPESSQQKRIYVVWTLGLWAGCCHPHTCLPHLPPGGLAPLGQWLFWGPQATWATQPPESPFEGMYSKLPIICVFRNKRTFPTRLLIPLR